MEIETNTLRLEKIIVASTVLLLIVGITLVFFGEAIFPSTPDLDERIDQMRNNIKSRVTGLQQDAEEIEKLLEEDST